MPVFAGSVGSFVAFSWAAVGSFVAFSRSRRWVRSSRFREHAVGSFVTFSVNQRWVRLSHFHALDSPSPHSSHSLPVGSFVTFSRPRWVRSSRFQLSSVPHSALTVASFVTFCRVGGFVRHIRLACALTVAARNRQRTTDHGQRTTVASFGTFASPAHSPLPLASANGPLTTDNGPLTTDKAGPLTACHVAAMPA